MPLKLLLEFKDGLMNMRQEKYQMCGTGDHIHDVVRTRR